jgi:hypothetical protein
MLTLFYVYIVIAIVQSLLLSIASDKLGLNISIFKIVFFSLCLPLNILLWGYLNVLEMLGYNVTFKLGIIEEEDKNE